MKEKRKPLIGWIKRLGFDILIIIGALLIILLASYVGADTQDAWQAFFVSAVFALLWAEVLFLLYHLKEGIIFTLILLALCFLDTSSINTIVIVFLFNTVYLNLFADYKWKEKKRIINEEIDRKCEDKKFIFDNEFYDMLQKQDKVIFTMLVQSVTILPSVGLKILIEQKDFIFEHASFIKSLYKNYLTVFRQTTHSEIFIKKFFVAIPVLLFFFIIDIAILLISKQVRDNRKKITDRNKRLGEYWENTCFELEDNDLIYIIKNPDYHPASNPSPNGSKCMNNGSYSMYEIACDECEQYLSCFTQYKI